MEHNFFANDPWYSMANLTAEVQMRPWKDYMLSRILPTLPVNSVSRHIQFEVSNGKITMVPAKPPGSPGMPVTDTKGRMIHFNVKGYPQSATVNVEEVVDRLKGGKPLTMQQIIKTHWDQMIANDQRVKEFLLQGALEGKILAVTEDGTPYVMEDFTSDEVLGAPPIVRANFNDPDLEMVDLLAEGKLLSQQGLGTDFDEAAGYAVIGVGKAAKALRTNKSIAKAKYLADFEYAGSDKISKVHTIDENMYLMSYVGYDLGGGLTALDLDVRVGDAKGTIYIVPRGQVIEEIKTPAPTRETVNTPGMDQYSWMVTNPNDPEAPAILKYWSGRFYLNKRPKGVVKIQLPV